MPHLMTFEETIKRYEAGENAFDLAIEKWERIKEAIRSAHSVQQFIVIAQGATIKVALSVEYNDTCHLCPLEGTCNQETEGPFSTVIRVMQASCVAGDILPPSTLLNLVDQLITDLKTKKEAFMKMRH
jgi:hypothetical protein